MVNFTLHLNIGLMQQGYPFGDDQYQATASTVLFVSTGAIKYNWPLNGRVAFAGIGETDSDIALTWMDFHGDRSITNDSRPDG